MPIIMGGGASRGEDLHMAAQELEYNQPEQPQLAAEMYQRAFGSFVATGSQLAHAKSFQQAAEQFDGAIMSLRKIDALLAWNLFDQVTITDLVKRFGEIYRTGRYEEACFVFGWLIDQLRTAQPQLFDGKNPQKGGEKI